LKSKNPEFNIPSVTVVTDVVDSLEWIYDTTNMYFVPSSEIKNRYAQKGINPDIIKVTGVPVKKEFCNNEPLESDVYKLLIVGGGRGLFDMDTDFFYYIDELLDNNSDKLEVTIICGKNDKLYDKLTHKKPLRNIKVLGFINNMPQLLKEHNLLITKPGGATLFEAIHSEIPVIVRLPKVGQEIENARFIIDKGIGIIYNDEDDLKEIVNSIANKTISNKVNFMKSNISNLKSTINLEHIADYILEL
ncbi:MAG: glycosyltransferase, partial [Paraclostridium sp.]